MNTDGSNDGCVDERSYPCRLVSGATDDELILGVEAAHFLVVTRKLHSGTSRPAVHQDLAITVEITRVQLSFIQSNLKSIHPIQHILSSFGSDC